MTQSSSIATADSNTTPDQPVTTHSRPRWVVGLVSAAILVALVLVWWLVYRLGWVSDILLPDPGVVWSRGQSALVTDGFLWSHVWITTQETLIAFVLGVAMGVAVGCIFAFLPGLRAVLYPYVLAAQSFPKIAIGPLLVAWFGYGFGPKLAIGAAIAFFPVMANTTAGLTEIDPDEIDLMRSMRTSKLQELRILRIPRAMSYLLPSLDVAIVGALLGVIAGEFIGSREGLGFMVQTSAFLGDIESVYLILIVMALLGICFKLATDGVIRLTPFRRSR